MAVMTATVQSPAEWVHSDRRLAELVQQWRQQPAVALDTEFIRSQTFFPIVGLLQIADSYGIYLLDPLAIEDPQPLRELLADSSVVKVIHSCSEDLEVFHRYLGVLPTPLFDTQVAAAFTGFGVSIGYANLVKAVEEKIIPKQETRSDWLQRPLSQSQLEYAALDVAHLLSLYQHLLALLTQSRRLDWVESDCRGLLDNFAVTDQSQHYFQRIKLAWKLKPHQLAVLQDLCQWREQQVRNLDIPRNRLVKDAVLWQIAFRLPENLKQLRRVKDIHPRFVDKHGKNCLTLIQEALDRKEEAYPIPLPPPLVPEQVDLLKQLKAKVQAIADGLLLPPELLARKRDLELLVRLSGEESAVLELPHTLSDWREPVIGQPLLHFLSD